MISRMEFYRYLPVSERDVQWGLYLTGVGASSVPPFTSTYPVRVHPDVYQFAWDKGRVLHEFQVLYITRGEGEFESGAAGAKPISGGTAILLFPGEWHRYRPRYEIGWDEYWLSFNGEVPERLVRHGFISPRVPVLAIGRDEHLLQHFQAILDAVRAESVGYQQLIASEVMLILAMILATARRQRSNNRHEAIVSQAKLLLQQPENLVSIERLAGQLSLSAAQLRRVFKEHTGVSPHQYYNQMRMSRAKELLRETSLTVKQIARQLCYESPYHFSKEFKKSTGRSPTDWRDGR
jgi:AraC-like DNA-binding protein